MQSTVSTWGGGGEEVAKEQKAHAGCEDGTCFMALDVRQSKIHIRH